MDLNKSLENTNFVTGNRIYMKSGNRIDLIEPSIIFVGGFNKIVIYKL